jgi:hypothetical protein
MAAAQAFSRHRFPLCSRRIRLGRAALEDHGHNDEATTFSIAFSD